MFDSSAAAGRTRFARTIAMVVSFAILVAHSASNVVEYTYDAAGNITNIARQAAGGFAITGFDPASGPVGATVTIYGTGFSTTPASNAVMFNGTAAAVSASDGGSISTSVPSGATTGRIAVTVGANTATSATDFVVTVPGAPTITSFSPSSGAAGTSVAVTGTNFNTTAGATSVTLNGVATTPSVASSTSLSFAVPAAAASGRIVATTSVGAGMSAQDFIVPPPGTSASEIATSVRVVPNGAAANLAVGTANTRGLVLFDGSADVYYTMQFGQLAVTPSSNAIAYSIIKPDNTVLAAGTFGIGSLRPTIHLPKLPVSGTYSVLVSPGLATFNSNVKVVADPPVTIDGSPVAIALDTIGQSTRLAFTATAGQRIGFGIAGLTLAPSSTSGTGLKLHKPDGSLESGTLGPCYAPSTSNPQGNCDAEILTSSAGAHTIVVEPPMATAAAFNTLLSTEVTGALVPDTGLDVTLGRVGQDARLTFTVDAGDSLGLALSGITGVSDTQTFYARVHKPDGSLFVQVSAQPQYGVHTEMRFPASGTYSVVLDPDRGAFGTARLTLKTGPTLLPTDPPTAFAPVTIAEAARFRFSGTAGQNLVVGISSIAYVGSSGSSSSLSIHRPDGTQHGQAIVCPLSPGRCKATLTNLPATGVYSAVMAPPGGVKVTGNASVSEDITGTLVAGTPVTVNASRDGQNARLTFAGTAGESTSLKLYGVSTTPAGQLVYAYVYKPDGNLLTSSYATAATSLILDFGPLPATGNYQVLAYSQHGHPWQGTLALDPGAMLDVDGAVAPLASATGEPLRYRFSGTAGQLLELGLTGLAYTPSGTALSALTLRRPDGGWLTSINCGTTGAGACETNQATLPTTGVYSVTLVPPGANAITGGTLAVSTPLTGTFVVGDPAQTVAIQRPGQTARYTFSGTSGQLLRLNWTGVSVSGGASVQVTVLKPDGSALSTSSFTNGASGGFDIASLPVAGTYTVVLNPASAATASASLALVTR